MPTTVAVHAQEIVKIDAKVDVGMGVTWIAPMIARVIVMHPVMVDAEKPAKVHVAVAV